MNDDVDFQAWNNDDRGASSDTYVGMQGQDNLNANDNSLETSAGTWVIVFDGTAYTGNCMKIGPSTYLSNLSNTSRYNNSGTKQGDWKNQIQSFILYKQKPTFWDSGSSYTQPNKSQLVVLHNGQSFLAENDDYTGANRTFSAPYNGSNLSNIGYTTNSVQMSGANSISSLKNGPNAWLLIFNDCDAKGNFKKVDPNIAENKLSEWTRIDVNGTKQGTWENEIDSFLLYSAEPGFWSTKYQRAYIDFTTLYNLYPSKTSSSSDSDIEYVVEDSTYKIDEPDFLEQSATQELSSYENDITTDLPTDGWTKYHIYQQHVNTGSHNDKAEYDVYFDNNGMLVSIQRFEWSSDGAFQVPQTIIKSVDLVAWYVGTASSLVSFGVGEEVANTFVDVFNFVCNLFNKIADVIYKATDNGGQFYFLPVICHTLNRICTTTLTPYNYPAYENPNDYRKNYKMTFNNNGFPSALTTALGSNGTAQNWTQKSSATGKTSTFNQVSEFTYQSYPFRTWYQETSETAKLGMFVSCKIDYEIDNNSKDDHIIILMGFAVPQSGNTPILSFAQAIVQFTDGSNSNIQSKAQKSDAINAVYDDLKSKLSGVTIGSDEQGRQFIAEVARANMNAISASMSYR